MSGPERDDRIPVRGWHTEAARQQRLEWLRRRTGQALPALSEMRVPAESLERNVENLIGAVEVPVGLAGPLRVIRVEEPEVAHDWLLPMATTEGALVASATRGALAISRAGGVQTACLGQRMVRAPLFEFESLAQAIEFTRWIETQRSRIDAAVREASRYAELVEIRCEPIGSAVHVEFAFETGEAAGQNMTTATTWRICEALRDALVDHPRIRLVRLQVEANLSGDKKASWRAFTLGRGLRLVAEARIPAAVCRRTFQATTAEMVSMYRHLATGAMRSGAIGVTVNTTNLLTAVFIATGQDAACAAESSVGQLDCREVDGPDGEPMLVASMTLPAVVIGTVGGGTHLPAQRALRDAIGATDVRSFGEAIVGFALALDLSTLAALATGAFVHAHEKRGRNRPKATDRTIASLLRPRTVAAHLGGDVVAVAPREQVVISTSILGDFTRRESEIETGIVPIRVHRDGGRDTDAVMKAKAPGTVQEDMVRRALSLLRPAIADVIGDDATMATLGFRGSDRREVSVLQRLAAACPDTVPALLGADLSVEGHPVMWLEDAGGAIAELPVADADRAAAVGSARQHLSVVHQRFQGLSDDDIAALHLAPLPTSEAMVAARPLWRGLLELTIDELPARPSDAAIGAWQRRIDTLEEWWPRYATASNDPSRRTLVHGDAGPRNALWDRASRSAVWIDWELSFVGSPARDIVEWHLWTAPTHDRPAASADSLAALATESFDLYATTINDAATWHAHLSDALADFTLRRLGLYAAAASIRDDRFADQLIAATSSLLAGLDQPTTHSV